MAIAFQKGRGLIRPQASGRYALPAPVGNAVTTAKRRRRRLRSAAPLKRARRSKGRAKGRGLSDAAP